MVLTILLVSIPPMAASFFNGVLGQFAAYSAFGTVGGRGGRDSAGRTPGDPGYQNQPTPRSTGHRGSDANVEPIGTYGSPNPGAQVTGSTAGSTIAQQDQIKQKGSAQSGT